MGPHRQSEDMVIVLAIASLVLGAMLWIYARANAIQGDEAFRQVTERIAIRTRGFVISHSAIQNPDRRLSRSPGGILQGALPPNLTHPGPARLC